MIFGTYYELMMDEEGNTGAYRFVGDYKSKKDVEYEKAHLRKRYPKADLVSNFRFCVNSNVQITCPNGKPYVPLHYRSPTQRFVGWLVIVASASAFVYCGAMMMVTFNGF